MDIERVTTPFGSRTSEQTTSDTWLVTDTGRAKFAKHHQAAEPSSSSSWLTSGPDPQERPFIPLSVTDGKPGIGTGDSLHIPRHKNIRTQNAQRTTSKRRRDPFFALLHHAPELQCPEGARGSLRHMARRCPTAAHGSRAAHAHGRP